MEHNLKTSYSDLAELEKEGIASIFGCNNNSLELEGNKSSEGESIVDLKLGNSFKQDHSHRGVSVMDPFSSPPGSSRRVRTPSGGAPVVSCLVDGCKSDLSKCRDYHRRHKVCEMHSKTPRVTIAGHEQRFCQQCSRFHSLGEFDEGKRSCRKRLEGHNRRRRKPQPDPLPVNHGNFLTTSQGSRYLPFNNQPMIAASSVVSTTWSVGIKPESNTALYSTSSVSVSYPHDQAYRGRQFPFLQGLDDPNSTSGNGGGSSNNNNNNDDPKMYCNGLIDSDRALSLLSSSPAEMGLGRVIHPNPINPAQPMMNGLHYNSIGQYPGPQGPGLEGQAGGPGLFSNYRSSSNNSLCQDFFQGGPDGSSPSGGHHQTLSFSWE